MKTLGIFLIFVLAGWVSAESGVPRRPKFEYFDDYLVSITADVPTTHNQVLEKEDEGQGHPRDSHVTPQEQTTTPAPADEQGTSSRDILGYFRDVPRRHWSCCMLGKLAGDKGFHCDANFYASRLTRRNRNRAHNRRMNFQGRDAIPNWGMNIMSTFERCIARHAAEFHKCCYAATIERREVDRWHYYRLATANVTEAPPQRQQHSHRHREQHSSSSGSS